MKWMDTETAELINRFADTYTTEEIREILIEHLWEEYKDESTMTLIEDVEYAEGKNVNQ